MSICTPGPDSCGSAAVVRPVNSSKSIAIGPRSSAPALGGPVGVGGAQQQPAELAACPERPSHGPNSRGSGSRGSDWHRQIYAERHRNVLHVDENIEEDIALVRHDGDLA